MSRISNTSNNPVQGIPLCALLNEYMNRLAGRFPETKFLRAISTTCIPNYPDKNLPTVFVYYEVSRGGALLQTVFCFLFNVTFTGIYYRIGICCTSMPVRFELKRFLN
jgi:hypothetical protein